MDSWQRSEVTASRDGGSTRFDGQLIIQLEDDPVVRNAAAALAGKHPDNSVLIQLDKDGHYRVVYGAPMELKGQLRWQVVGHGRGGTDETHHTRLGGYTPAALAVYLADFSKAFSTQFAIHSDAHYVSLVGCALTDKDNPGEGYAKPFAEALGQEGIQADIAVRRTQVGVTGNGQKLTRSRDGVWGHKISDNKLIFSWNNQGELVPATHLAVRLTRAISLVDALADGDISLSSLDATEQATLADFFPQLEGKQDVKLDIKQLALTIFDEMNYAVWRQEAHQLLQLQDAHPQLNRLNELTGLPELTGQQALQHSRHWHESLTESIVALSKAKLKNRVPGVLIQTQLAPQGIYIGNETLHPRSYAKSVGLAWLNARSLGQSEAQHFFNGLMLHGMINEQKTERVLSVGDLQQIKAFREHFDQLKQTDLGSQAIFIPQSTAASTGDYLRTYANRITIEGFLSC